MATKFNKNAGAKNGDKRVSAPASKSGPVNAKTVTPKTAAALSSPNRWTNLAAASAKNPTRFIQTAKAGSNTKPVAGTPAATGAGSTTAQTPAPPVSPFLTPAQQMALTNWNTKYGTELAKLSNADINAYAKMGLSQSADETKNVQQVDATNQNMAARGMFQSSIRDGALNDLASTLAQQENLLRANYHTTLLNDQTSRENLAGENVGEQTYYNSLAVGNAQAIPPDTTMQGATSPGSAGAASAPPKPAPAPAAAVKPGTAASGPVTPKTVAPKTAAALSSPARWTNLASAAAKNPQMFIQAAKAPGIARAATASIRAPGVR